MPRKRSQDDTRLLLSDLEKLDRLPSYQLTRAAYRDAARRQPEWWKCTDVSEAEGWLEALPARFHSYHTRSQMFTFDDRKLRDSVLQEISLGAKNGLFIPPGTPANFLPGVGTSALPHAALQQVQNALGAMRDDLANHTTKPYSGVNWDDGVEWCNILDPRLFCTAMPHDEEHADDFIPTRYTHHGGKGFARDAYINGTQLMPADVVGGFDAAATAFLEAAFPLLAQTLYISESDDGGVSGGPDASPLTLTADETAEADEFSELLLRRFSVVKILKGPVPVEKKEEGEQKKEKKKKPRGKRARGGEEEAEESCSVSSRLETLGATGAGPREDGAFMKELDGLLSAANFQSEISIYGAMSVAMPAEEENVGGGEGGCADDEAPPGKKQRKADLSSPWDLAHTGSLDALRSTAWVCWSTVNYHHRDHGTTLLYTAARSGHHDICKWLLSQGADANVPCTDAKSRSTPLHAAAYGGHPEVVRLLLDNGADRAAKNAYGDTPLDDAKNTKGTAAAGAMCVKALNGSAKQAPPPVAANPTGTPCAHALVSCVEKDPQATPETLRAMVVSKALELASGYPFLLSVPDPREVVLKRKQMEAYRAARPRLGGLLQEGMNVVWQASDVRLTPENRVFLGSSGVLGPWGVKRCVASLLLVVGCDNVTPSVIRVQERVPEGLLLAQPSEVYYPLLCGMESGVCTTRLAAEVPLVPGALVSMHREHVHSIAPFQLLDATKPGRLTLLWMMVVDPDGAQADAPVLTTSEVPDTSEWISPKNALDHARVMMFANTKFYEGDFASPDA